MNAELIKEVNPGFKPITVQVTITTQEEYDAIQRAGKSLLASEINVKNGFTPYSLNERTIWVFLLELIAQELYLNHKKGD
tara:strand:+ start:389 stop:628 length:240 start_codon:yes stop_codon:yes gene_type:complete